MGDRVYIAPDGSQVVGPGPPENLKRTGLTYPGTAFPWEFETGYTIEQLRKGTLLQYERAGYPIATADEANSDPNWGVTPKSTDLDERNQYDSPYSSSEIIRCIDVQRCVAVDPAVIVPGGVAFELAHWRVPTGAVLVIEDVPTIFDRVDALAADGVTPILSYSELNGERLCRDQLDHPDPAVTVPLTWQFFLVYDDDPTRQVPTTAPTTAYQGPIPPTAITGTPIAPAWSDARYGGQNRWAENQQYFAPSSTITRFWVVLRGPTSRFSVRVGARLNGFWQPGGRKGSALAAVQQRRV